MGRPAKPAIVIMLLMVFSIIAPFTEYLPQQSVAAQGLASGVADTAIAAPSSATSAATTGEVAPPPLPRGCGGGGTPIDYDSAVCCMNGYVYLNGSPVEGATVTISLGTRSIEVKTRTAPDSDKPYFTVSLHADPLNVQPNDIVTITASAGGQTKTQTFVAKEGGQQVDVVLPQTAGSASWVSGGQMIQERSYSAMAYDEARHRTVLFGGSSYDSQANRTSYPTDTWEWDGTTWTLQQATISPPGRSRHGMAYDSARGRIVLFGGVSPNGALYDTWEWDGSNWTQRTPQHVPFLTGDIALAYDVEQIGRAHV